MLDQQPSSVKKPVLKNFNKDAQDMENKCWEGQNVHVKMKRKISWQTQELRKCSFLLCLGELFLQKKTTKF
jgi:hypothetical protein